MPSAIRLLEKFREAYAFGTDPALDRVASEVDDFFERQGALKGLVGLFDMIINRDDISPAVREAIEKNHRYITARRVVEAEEQYAEAMERTLDTLIDAARDVVDHLHFNKAVPVSMHRKLEAEVEIAQHLKKQKELNDGNQEQSG
jgi:hypothetical protein